MMRNVGLNQPSPRGGGVEVVVSSDDPRNRLIIANVVTNALRQHGFDNVDTLDSQTCNPLPEANAPSLMDRIWKKNPNYFHTPITVWSAPDPEYIVRAAMDACPPYEDLDRQRAVDELVPMYPNYGLLDYDLGGERVPAAPPIESLMTGFIANPGSVAAKNTEFVITYPDDRAEEAFDKIDEYEQRYKDLKFLAVPATSITEEQLSTANEKAAYQKRPKKLLSPEGQENFAAMKAGLDRLKAEKLNAAVAGVSVKGVGSKWLKISELPPDHPMRLMTEQALMEGFTPTQMGVF